MRTVVSRASLASLPRRAAIRTWRVLGFGAYFGWQFLVANAEVLWEIITPRSRSAPAVIAVPMQSRTSREMVTIANLVTLTPGTLALELALEPPILYVHGMFVHDPEEFIDGLRTLERRMLAALRPIRQEVPL